MLLKLFKIQSLNKISASLRYSGACTHFIIPLKIIRYSERHILHSRNSESLCQLILKTVKCQCSFLHFTRNPTSGKTTCLNQINIKKKFRQAVSVSLYQVPPSLTYKLTVPSKISIGCGPWS